MIRLLPLFIAISFVFFGCKAQNSKLTSYKIVFNIPFVREPSGELMNVTDSVKILYYNEFILCETKVKQVYKKDDEFKKDTFNYNYFIFKKGSKSGYVFETLNTNDFEKEVVDSFLNAHYFGGTDFGLNIKNCTEITSNKSKGILTKVYLPKTRPDPTYADTILCYYSDCINKVDYSFAPSIDTISNMKLSKIRFVYNAEKDKDYAFILPARELYVRLDETKTDKEKEVINFIKRFERENK